MGNNKCIRELREELEHKMLCEYASFSDSGAGRDVEEEPDLRHFKIKYNSINRRNAVFFCQIS